MAVGTAVQRRNIEQCEQADKKSGRAHQADDNTDQLATPVTHIECDVWQKGKREQKAKHESNQMGIVVDHRQQTDYKQDKKDAAETAQSQ